MQLINEALAAQDGQAHSYCRKVVFAIVTLSLIIFSIYGNSFDCSWHFDDEPNITHNPNLHLKEIKWENIKRAIFSDRNNPHLPYRPLACLSFALNHFFGGLDVFGYHLVNISIHLLSSIFLFLFIYLTLNLPSLRTKYASKSYSIALLATILWAMNPVQTQAITYLVQRMASMAGMFYIISMFFYLKTRTSETTTKKISFLILCFVSFAMALGSKENTAMLPLSIFFYEVLLMRSDPGSFLRKNLRVFLVVFGGIFLLGLTYIYIIGGNIFSFLNAYENRPFTLTQRLLTEPRIIISYISLLLYPMPNRLNIAHSIQISASLFDPVSTVFSILFIIGTITYAIYLTKRRPLFSFCILFFFLNHVIESTIFPLELVFEHRNYIPSMLFFVPLVIGFFHLLDYYAAKKSMQYILLSFIVLLLIGFGHSTFMRNFTWKNEKSLWIDAVEKSPDLLRPHHNLGRYYDNNGYKKEATLEYESALEKLAYNRKNEVSGTYYNLGRIYAEFKDYDKALHFYNKSAALDPCFSPVYNNIAGIMNQQGNNELAYTYLIKALRLDPEIPETNYNLGLHYLGTRQPDKAIIHLNKSVHTKYKSSVSLNLGIAYKQKGRLGRAVTYFRDALRKDPRNINPHLHLAEVFHRLGDIRKAKREAERAVDMIRDKDTFNKILHDLTQSGQSVNLQPKADIVIPILKDACLGKSKMFKEWGELLEEKPLGLKKR